MIFTVLIVVSASGCGVLTKPSSGSRDHLLGWYRLEDRDVIIPVFKAEGNYYTVSWPAAEIPLRPCPEGLQWALTPSSMTGTTIIYDEQSSYPYYISVYDSMAVHHTAHEEADWWGRGKKRPLTKIDAPSWLPDSTARRARVIEDFLGRHLKALQTERAVRIKKHFVGVRPRTTVFVTASGRDGFMAYLKALEQVLKKAAKSIASDSKKASMVGLKSRPAEG